MALASDIIRRAFRESNLIPIGQAPNANQMSEGIELLNSLILSTVGNEVSDGFDEIIIGGDFDQSELLINYLPVNTRIVFSTLDGPIALGLNPYPKDGHRIAIVDTDGNISTNTVTLEGNGRTIEGASSVTVDTDLMNRQWMYRADSGNWVRISELVSADPMPFPTEFDDYFSTMLAMRLNPRFSQQIPQEVMQALTRQRSQLRARYAQIRELESDLYPYDLATYKFNKIGVVDFDTGAASHRFPYLPDKGF